MNLYEIQFEHFSQKDSEKGILTYLAANSDEEVYEWLKSEPKISEGKWIFNNYKYNEGDNTKYEIYDDEYNVVGEESFKERMIRLRGEMYDDTVELNDLYYGKTLHGWALVKVDAELDMLSKIGNYGIPIESV